MEENVILGLPDNYELLEAKLQKRIKEFLENKSLGELNDFIKVLFAIAKNLGYRQEEFLRMM